MHHVQLLKYFSLVQILALRKFCFVIDEVIMNFVLFILVYPIQNFTSKLIFRVFSSQLDLPFITYLQQRECGLTGECISHNMHFSFLILNVKIKRLNFTHPFLLPIIEFLLGKEMSNTVVISLHNELTSHQILPKFDQGMHDGQHLLFI